jgi:TonB family protein
MWRNSRFLILVVLLVLSELNALSVSANGDVEKQLKAEYQGKVLTLRHFYSGEHLRFGPDGNLIGEAKIGSWTVDGQLLVKNIHLRGRILNIEGRRLSLFFDPDTKQFRDVSDVREGDQAAKLFTTLRDRGSPRQLAQQQHVEIEIELASETPDSKEISLATNTIFLAPPESLADVVPSFWRSFFARQEGRAEEEPSFDEPVYRAKQGEVSAPSVLYQPEPEYSEPAREAGYQGMVAMSFVVDTSGTPKDIQITKPAGLGLDEKSVEAVSAWKFQPGQRQQECWETSRLPADGWTKQQPAMKRRHAFPQSSTHVAL